MDDSPSVREITTALLTRIGYKVISASSGEAGIENIQVHGTNIAWVVLDIRMPGLGGVEACRVMRQLHPNIPIVLVSGDAGGDEVLKLTEDPHTSYVQKPYGLNSLLQAMHDLRGGNSEDDTDE